METILFSMLGLGLFGGTLVYLVLIFNSLMAIKNNIDRARANIDVLLKQRFDEIPQLVNVCKGYIKYEGSILEKLATLRNQYNKTVFSDSDKDAIKKVELNQTLNGYSKELYALAESYPNLKASNQFLYLQERFSEIEMQIADRRELFNDSVNIFNTRIDSFPDMILAFVLRYKKYALFEIPTEEKEFSKEVFDEK